VNNVVRKREDGRGTEVDVEVDEKENILQKCQGKEGKVRGRKEGEVLGEQFC